MSRDRVKESYKAYKRMYNEWADKDYSMYSKMTLKEYREKYKLAQDIGMKNIARTFAHNSIETTASEARAFKKGITTEKTVRERVYNEKGKYSTKAGERYDIKEYKLEVPEEIRALSVKEITKMGASELFERLREEYGMTAREAGSIVDELYRDKR